MDPRRPCSRDSRRVLRIIYRRKAPHHDFWNEISYVKPYKRFLAFAVAAELSACFLERRVKNGKNNRRS